MMLIAFSDCYNNELFKLEILFSLIAYLAAVLVPWTGLKYRPKSIRKNLEKNSAFQTEI